MWFCRLFGDYVSKTYFVALLCLWYSWPFKRGHSGLSTWSQGISDGGLRFLLVPWALKVRERLPSIQKTLRAPNNFGGIIFWGVARNYRNRLHDITLGELFSRRLAQFYCCSLLSSCSCSMLPGIDLHNGHFVTAPKYFWRITPGRIARNSRNHCAKDF